MLPVLKLIKAHLCPRNVLTSPLRTRGVEEYVTFPEDALQARNEIRCAQKSTPQRTRKQDLEFYDDAACIHGSNTNLRSTLASFFRFQRPQTFCQCAAP